MRLIHSLALGAALAVLASPAALAGNCNEARVIKASMTEAAKPAGDVVDIALADERFSTLVAALTAAGLVDTLKGEGPFTVFAPTNDAFAKLPAGTVETLLKPENKDQLVAVLTYHVLAGKVASGDLAGKTIDAATVQGATIKADGTAGVKINDATVIAADVMATNGIIHVIDTVLLPPAADAATTN